MAGTNRIIVMLILFILLVLFSPIIKHYVRMLYATEDFKAGPTSSGATHTCNCNSNQICVNGICKYKGVNR